MLLKTSFEVDILARFMVMTPGLASAQIDVIAVVNNEIGESVLDTAKHTAETVHVLKRELLGTEIAPEARERLEAQA